MPPPVPPAAGFPVGASPGTGLYGTQSVVVVVVIVVVPLVAVLGLLELVLAVLKVLPPSVVVRRLFPLLATVVLSLVVVVV